MTYNEVNKIKGQIDFFSNVAIIVIAMLIASITDIIVIILVV